MAPSKAPHWIFIIFLYHQNFESTVAYKLITNHFMHNISQCCIISGELYIIILQIELKIF